MGSALCVALILSGCSEDSGVAPASSAKSPSTSTQQGTQGDTSTQQGTQGDTSTQQGTQGDTSTQQGTRGQHQVGGDALPSTAELHHSPNTTDAPEPPPFEGPDNTDPDAQSDSSLGPPAPSPSESQTSTPTPSASPPPPELSTR